MNAVDDLRFLPVGRHALLVEVSDTDAARWVYRLVQQLIADPELTLEPPRDVVPAARTVLLDQIDDVRGWQRALHDRVDLIAGRDEMSQPDSEPGEQTVIATRYDGPDLGHVAAVWGCSLDEVVRRHAAASFEVAFCGFAPGFAYCTSDLVVPETPRRDEPRSSVPAGSVALAGRYCGIYPRAMPGGWQLIGTTDAVLFDPERAVPALLSPGDLLRFEPVP
jgi:KipI family sensor histidine kinase inhibitor